MSGRFENLFLGPPGLRTMHYLSEEGRVLYAVGPPDTVISTAVQQAPWPRQMSAQCTRHAVHCLRAPLSIAVLRNHLIVVDSLKGLFVLTPKHNKIDCLRLKLHKITSRPGSVAVHSDILFIASLSGEVFALDLQLGTNSKAQIQVLYKFGSRFSAALRGPAKLLDELTLLGHPSSLTIAESPMSSGAAPLLIIADIRLHRVTAWHLDGRFAGVICDSRSVYEPRSALTIGQYLVVFDVIARDHYVSSHLRVQVLSWRLEDGLQAQTKVVYTMQMPGKFYDLSAAYMPLFTRANTSESACTDSVASLWAGGVIIASDLANKRILKFAWRPDALEMVSLLSEIDFEEKEPISVAVADSVWVLCYDADELWEFPAGAPRPV